MRHLSSDSERSVHPALTGIDLGVLSDALHEGLDAPSRTWRGLPLGNPTHRPVDEGFGSEPKKRVLSIGYQGRSIRDFIGALKHAGVEQVIDVRIHPASRKRGFSKPELREALGEAGIGYVHQKTAGNPFYQERDLETSLTLYRQHLDAHPRVVEVLKGLIEKRRSALLCFEADSACCHRSVLIEALKARSSDLQVQHL